MQSSADDQKFKEKSGLEAANERGSASANVTWELQLVFWHPASTGGGLQKWIMKTVESPEIKLVQVKWFDFSKVSNKKKKRSNFYYSIPGELSNWEMSDKDTAYDEKDWWRMLVF